MSYVHADPYPDKELTNNYVLNHWQGRHSLPRSYWLNGTLIVGVVTLLALSASSALEAGGASLQLISALALTGILSASVVWLWGVVGIWRSAGNHIECGGREIWGYLARIAVAFGALGWAVQAPDLLRQSAELGQLALGRDSLGTPAVVRLLSGNTLEIRGNLTQGTAERVSEALQFAPDVDTVALNSTGGRLLEARRIALLISARHLDTVVEKECSSACVVTLLAGVKRTTAIGARVGLHQPMFPGETGQAHDEGVATAKQYYLQAGVRADFVERAMATRPDDMWYPSEAELISAGVLTGLGSDRVRADNVASANELNGKAPIRLDDFTLLTRAEAKGMTLTYYHRVLALAEQFEPKWLQTELPQETSKTVCSNDTMKSLVTAGAIYRYVYVDKTGAPLTKFSIDRCA